MGVPLHFLTHSIQNSGGHSLESPLTSTEIFNPESKSFSLGPHLPSALESNHQLYRPCVVPLNATHAVVVQERYYEADQHSYYIYDFESTPDHAWSELPKGLTDFRVGHSCGLVKDP